MTKPIGQQYLQYVTNLERDDLLNHDNNRYYNQLIEDFKNAQFLYDKAVVQLHGPKLEEVKKVQAQLNYLFLAPRELYATVPPMDVHRQVKNIQYLRIAAEHKEVQLVRKYFRTLSIEQRRSAFNLLCGTFGRPLYGEKTSKNGIHHIASDPRKLLSPVNGVEGAPRIIDVLLASCSAAPKPTTQELINTHNASIAQRKQIVDQTFHSGPVTYAKAADLAASPIASESPETGMFLGAFRDLKGAFAASAPKSPQQQLEDGHKRIVDAATSGGTLSAQTVHSDPQGHVTRFHLNKATEGKIDCAKLFAFCGSMGAHPNGMVHMDILGQEDRTVLSLKEEMRWVFPLAEEVNDPHFVDKFKADNWCMGRLKNVSFPHLLKVCGLERLKDGGIVRKTGSFSGTIFTLMNPKEVQWQRNIERILKCMKAMGFANDAHAFLAILKDIKMKEGKDAIPQVAIDNWNKALGLN